MTMRNGEEFSDDHPLRYYEPPDDADCVADVPPEVLNKLIEYHGEEEPEGEPIPKNEELV